MKNEQKKVISDVAFNDLKEFLKLHNPKDFRRGKVTDESIKDDYIDVLEAIEDGLLTFSEDKKPSYKLRKPLFEEAEDKSLMVTNVDFRTRIREADKTRIMNGINIEKERGTFVLKTLAYICKLSMAEVDRLEKDDFSTLNQLCSVF